MANLMIGILLGLVIDVILSVYPSWKRKHKLMGQTVCTVKRSFVVDEDGLARILVERV